MYLAVYTKSAFSPLGTHAATHEKPRTCQVSVCIYMIPCEIAAQSFYRYYKQRRTQWLIIAYQNQLYLNRFMKNSFNTSSFLVLALFSAITYHAKSEIQTKACSIMRVDYTCRTIERNKNVQINVSNSSNTVNHVYKFKNRMDGLWYDQDGYSWHREDRTNSILWSGGKPSCSRPDLCRGTALLILK